MKTKTKRILAVILATALLAGMFTFLFTTGAGAMDLSKSHEVSWDHTLTDENNNTFTWYTGLTAANNPYGYPLEARQRSMHDYTVKRLGLTGNSNNWTYNEDYVYAFCIEHGVPVEDDTSYRGSASATHGNKWEAMSESQKKLIQLALTYGYPNYGDVQTAKDANACYAATQLIVWQISFNFRTSATALNDRTYPMSGHSGTMTQQLTANAHLKRYYDSILSAMAKHYTIPSFAGINLSSAPAYALNYVGGQYTMTLTDTNGVLSQFYVINQGGVGYNISGNTMTITSPVPFGNVAEITLGKRMPTTGATTGFLIWSVPGKENSNQDMVTGVDYDPVQAYIRVTAQEPEQPKGTLKIYKKVNDGSSLSGFQFEVRNSSGTLVGTYTTDSTGVITIPNLFAGSYSIKEINIPAGYVVDGWNPVTLSVWANETTGVDFVNNRQQGQITVKKINSNPGDGDYSLANAVFEIWNPSGSVLYDTITTNASGVAVSGMLNLGSYTVREKTAPEGFIRNPGDFPVTLSAGGTEVLVGTEVTVPNAPQTGRVTINKVNVNPSMGSYSLAGAVFEIFDGSRNLVDTVTTDASGNAQSKTLKLGYYTIAEKTAPYGYVRNATDYVVHLAYAGQNVQLATASADVPEQPQVGIIHVNKSNGNPSLGDYALSGAIFEVLNSGGTIVGQTAFGEIRMEAKTDKDGVILLEGLPVGKYTVIELESELTKGYVLSPAQTISVAGGKIAEMTINNKLQRGSLKVVKTFEGKTTPVEGVPFMIVGQTAVGEIRRQANTDKNGEILLENLPVGVYTVTEMRSNLTTGYVLSPAQTVTVTAGKAAEVKIENKLQRGSLKIIKTFEGRAEPLEGVPFLVVGQTVNGEVRFEVKTDKNGEILLKDLPVGTYTVTEQKADITASYVLAPAQIVTIAAGSEAILKITNQLAKGEIRVLKIDKETGEPLEGAMFGLYKDGKLIAEAKSGKDGYAIFKDVAFGEYEIKELSAPVGYNRSEEVLKAVVGKDGSVLLFEVTNERIPGEPVEPEEPETPVGPDMPVPGPEPLPKTGDSKTIVVIALVVLILAGGAVLWLRKRGKDEDEPSEEPAE